MIGRQTMVSSFAVPAGPELKGGVLVFFPSYGVLEGLKRRWTETGLWEKLRSTMGSIVVETKGSSNSNSNSNSNNSSGSSGAASRGAAPNHFGGARAADALNSSASNSSHSGSSSNSKGKGGDGDITSSDSVAESTMAAFEAAISGSGGKCVLLAVCR